MTDVADVNLVVTTPAGGAEADLLAAALAARGPLIVIGRPEDEASLVALGVRPRAFIAVEPGLRGRWIARRRLAPCLGGAPRVAAWGEAAAEFLTRSGPSVRLVATEPPVRPAAWSRVREVVVMTDADERAWRAVGAAVERRDLPPLPEPPPNAAGPSLAAGRELVVAPLARGVRDVDARRLAFLAGVVVLLDQPVRLRLPSAATRRAAAARFMRVTGLSVTIELVDGPVAAAWSGADIVFEVDHGLAPLAGSAAERLITAWAASRGADIRRSAGSRTFGGPAEPVVNTLWWAGELPARLKHEPAGTA